MSITDEQLMAYADGELADPEHNAERQLIEAAIETDPAIARRVEQRRALRGRNPPPRTATITDIGRVRAAKASKPAARPTSDGPARPLWTWPQLGAVAASLAIGAVIAYFTMRSGMGPIGIRDGELTALAGLDQALTDQLTSTQAADAPISIGISFKSKSGDVCRTFVIQGEKPLGGFACREGEAWRVRALARVEGSTGASTFRPASSSLPATILSEVQGQIVGDPFDANAEAQAQGDGWK